MSRLIKSNVVCGDKIMDRKGALVCNLLSDGEYFIKVSDLAKKYIRKVKDKEVVRGDGSTSLFHLLELEQYSGVDVVVVSFIYSVRSSNDINTWGVNVKVGVIDDETAKSEMSNSMCVYACIGPYNNVNSQTIHVWFDDDTMMEFKCQLTGTGLDTVHVFIPEVMIFDQDISELL